MWQVEYGYPYNNDKGEKNLAAGFATNFQVQDMETPPNKLKDFSTTFFPHIHFYAL